MNGEQSGFRDYGTTPRDVPALTLVVKRVLGAHAWQPVRARFGFDPAAPMLVCLTLAAPRGPSVTWRVGRELLYRGLFEESGEGDVQVWPSLGQESEIAFLLLDSGESSAVLELPVPELVDWLEGTYALVPAEAEAEAVDWEGTIAALLDPARRRAQD
ncbi:SsgA family sporulation/cell division regulator [Streptacidiphilus jiangxiensis]|uniref:Streptomyces sporulation and cell division protein, SsgA n=1 Tax=Streptacidiphilus jiangxiensis TaxID=235985 RepID=A0A1H7WHL1_STRJI|nr:SsgA family sporulation/cell division regulator [Streptacidiphilus jiangxiensis]SEM20595.1 Streptomyces sporulation and cell division protein, SsgA [Streptacidiphilus jiangxiensis]